MYKIARYFYVFSLVLSLCVSSAPVRATDEIAALVEPTMDLTPSTVTTSGEIAVPMLPTATLEKAVSSIATQEMTTKSPLVVVEPVVAPIAPLLAVDDSPVVPISDLLVTGFGVSSDRRLQFLQLNNTDERPYLLSGVSIELVYANSETEVPCRINLDGYLLPKEHLLLAPEGTATIAQPHEGVIRQFHCEYMPGLVLENVLLYQHGHVIEDVRLSYFAMPSPTAYAWMRKGITASSRTGEAKDFVLFNSALHRLYGSDIYLPPETIPLEIIEVLIDPDACMSGDIRLVCHSYVKVYNPSDQPVDLAHYRLRGGEIDKSSTSSNTSLLHGVVAGRSFAVVTRDMLNQRLAINTTAGTVWFQDVYGLKNYPSTVTPYAGASNVGNKGKSWAYDSDRRTWAWGNPSPSMLANDFRSTTNLVVASASQGLKPCDDNQYRSEETNRCRTVSVATVQTPCREGQYRNEETNRCRNIALAGGTLTPCKDTQYRSEETNRCRNVVTTASTLVPCKDNQYRSEETNRCRTIASTAVPAAAFAVQPIADTSTAFIGWWVLGGLGAMALVYGAWEWRREVMTGVQRIATFFTNRK